MDETETNLPANATATAVIALDLDLHVETETGTETDGIRTAIVGIGIATLIEVDRGRMTRRDLELMSVVRRRRGETVVAIGMSLFRKVLLEIEVPDVLHRRLVAHPGG